MSALDDLLALGAGAAKLDPRIFVEMKDAAKTSELDRQWSFKRDLGRIAPKIMVAAIPNGTHIASHAGRNKATKEGRLKGYPDLNVLWAGGGFAVIEFKDGKGMPSEAQVERLNQIVSMGHSAAICRTAMGAMHWLRSIGAPIPEFG